MTNAKTATKTPAPTRAKVTTSQAATAKSAVTKVAAPKTPKPAPAKSAAVVVDKKAAAPEAAKPKHKLVRDSFTIPKSEYLVLEALKLRAAKLARPTKKSEVLRAGIAALAAMGDKAFLAALGGVPSLKTGRPKTTA